MRVCLAFALVGQYFPTTESDHPDDCGVHRPMTGHGSPGSTTGVNPQTVSHDDLHEGEHSRQWHTHGPALGSAALAAVADDLANW